MSIKGRKGGYAHFAANAPFSVEVVTDAPTAATGQCAVLTFPAGRCVSSGTSLRCN